MNAMVWPRWSFARLRALLPPGWREVEMGVELLALVASLLFSLLYNTAFWQAAAATHALEGLGGLWLMACLFVAMTALHWGLLCVLLTRWTLRPVLALLFVATALAAHFMQGYGIYLDVDMLRNILHTDGKEAGELLTPGLVLPTLVWGVLPAALLWRVRVLRRPWLRALAVRALCIGLAAAIAAAAILLSFQPMASLMRNHPDLRHLITPGNYLVALADIVAADKGGDPGPRIPVGSPARVAARAPGAKPRLLVVVVGETIRARNWGLNGYARQTTPALARIGPVNYTDVTACGSSTEVSVPCMFSPQGRARYDKRAIERSESLLHVLEHAGIHTLWRDNQTGCKGVCEGLAFESFRDARDPRYCTGGHCLDEILLRDLDAVVAATPGDMVLVLHQLGAHGPSYFARYPSRLARYAPACATAELGDCTRAQVVNAYDNAVLYTDEFLASAIGRLASIQSRDTALLYVSDHGESLGEHGLYLHGVPYAMAPDTQLKVPMVAWLSAGMAARQRIDTGCLKRGSAAPASHDNLFHSVLGLMRVRTPEYRPELDLFAACTGATLTGAGASP
jgi:lipid A ethanolaminephosphotransferase